ncbi:hypothetical protein X801_06666 [Opisthorchis viverrini]|uniref:MAP kinase-activating death domain-containing protein n=1 Tax=Opisthorchis viverrini TaxID=6198 RepID=A0A1S8WSW7_OPIVI|nr:hypothetical protein X801_06666 [Opisthorchis viverrini]
MKDLIHQSNLQAQRTRKPRTGRTYVFEDLVNESGRRNKLWDDMQFWEDAFLDAVAQERDILGMDFRPTELLTRYNLANPLKKKHLELAEDRLLAGLMHNLISFMVMLEVSLPDIRKKVRRLLAKSHMGLHYSQEISHLLDVLEYLVSCLFVVVSDSGLLIFRQVHLPFDLKLPLVAWGKTVCHLFSKFDMLS